MPSLALCHISGSHIFEKSRFLKKLKNRLVSKIDLAGSRRVRRNYFSKMPGNIPPKDPFAKGAPLLEPLWHSARFACPGTRIPPPKNPPKERGAIPGPSFLRLKKLGVRECSISRCSRSSQGDATFCPLWHSARFPDPTFLKIPDFCKSSKIDLSQKSIWLGPVA